MDESQEFEEELDSELDRSLEAKLRAGLRSLPAPEGFADRVLSRALAASQSIEHEGQPAVTRKMPRSRRALPFSVRQAGSRVVLRSSIAAALLLAIALGGYFGHRQEQRIAGEHARQQVLLALRITGSTLQTVRRKVESERPENNTN